ncbi:MAG: preprotein translocase subunit SecG [Lachnospiraceae bacterium]|jgi:preprotein translocase subunit SecG|nr:preprotein translocase subunit SecG [Lachnospiraceae bacterium]HBR04446.1 preprotein translocase subunit SecG [Lachnospiraceae bacterium]
METLRAIVTIVYVLICIALTILVLMQEGKQSGLGALAGASDSYWSKNKGRSVEGSLKKGTRILGLFFIILSIVINLPW